MSLLSGRIAAGDIEVGVLTFSDASEFKGTLKHGIPDGLGECVWADGNKVLGAPDNVFGLMGTRY
jgi:hypothetical protein